MDEKRLSVVAMVGEVIQKTKDIESYLDLIIYNYVGVYKLEHGAFFKNVILNSSVMSFGSKIKVVKLIERIVKEQDIAFEVIKWQEIHRLNNIRNLFAHETVYVETSETEQLLNMNELASNGTYDTATVEKYYEKFLSIYWNCYNNLRKFNRTINDQNALINN